LWYRARTTRFDANFRLLDTHLEVVTPSGVVIATAVLTSYVPFSPAAPDVGHLAAALRASRDSLPGKVALVLGGSRGLGAEIAAGLALAGCRVYAAARQDISQDQPWLEELRTHGGQVEFLQGDVGDPAWCDSTLNLLRERHGRIDALVLNACAPPGLLRFGSESAVRHAAYVRENLRLVETPLAAFAGALETSGGAVVCISSSFVQDPPAGFGHYVAVKQAAEALVRTLCRERPRLAALIARPPVLQTRWNDTPAAAVGAIPAEQAAVHIVNALGVANAGTAVVLSEFPPAETATALEAAPAAVADFSIRLAATFTIDPVVPAMRFWAEEFDAGAGIETAPYGQVLQSLLDPGSVFNAAGRGVNILFLRVRDWLRELADAQADDIDFVRAYLQDTVRDFERAASAHRGRASSETLLIVCPSYGTLSSAESILLRQAEADVVAGVSGLPGLHVVLASEFHSQYGVNEDDVHDELRDDIAHIPYREEYLCVLATIAARHVHRQLTPARKVVVVDCDNTLWRGVVGELGADGIQFDEEHRALHAVLQRLAQSGVLVCLCSKNDEDDVWRVFDTRADLRLRREDIVASAINWLPKSENLRTLAARLNLGLDSFVFIDDNPVECAEVQAGCPEVLTICWPQEPSRAARLVQHVWEFDPRKTTREDARRTELYREEFQRQQARAETLTFADFIDSLQLVVDIQPLAADDVRRAAQLTLRTNQFNFTTIRREEADLLALASGGAHEIRTIRVRDRFGDYGLVGLVIVDRSKDDWELDTFLLSCRVLGRGVEHRIVADLGEQAVAAGTRHVRLRLETTKRNTPARTFLESIVPAEFRRADERGMACEVPAARLADVRFEPTRAAEAAVQDEGESQSGERPSDANRLRRRESQILRTAFDLATGADLRAAIGGAPGGSVIGEATADADIAAIVHGAFARALRLPAERVAAVDNLEALGCDSLRIVETTVALREKFPWIPATLLFEHRSISAIVSEISRRSSPPQAAAPAAATRVAPAHHEPGSSAASNDVAVVGMHVRCAGVNSPDELWDLLSEGRSSVRPVPNDRHRFLQPLSDSRPHWAGLIEEPAQFDAAFFGVSPREAEFMDPQLRLFLEVAWSALEDAGCAGDQDADTGVFAGVMYGDYGFRANLGVPGAANPYRCWEGFSLANRLSQLLGFHGPSIAVDTACSSSGTALHLACAALKAGDCRIAVVGGVNLILDPDRFASLGRLGILSNRGRCEPFGAEADGTVLGEGAGVVVLRPLEDALRRGDRIYGVIKGTGISTGSGTVGFTAPNPQAQAAAIRRALTSARVDPRTVTYVETHGTGTALGDPIEVRGLALGYGSPELHDPDVSIAHRATIGSIKPNIGHLEAGAGVLGLIKVLLQLSRRTILPSITSAQPNPQIPFADGPFDVQRTLAHWTPPVMRLKGSTMAVPRRAGLSSFGVGGANAHVIVEEAPSTAGPSGVDRPIHVLALSATSENALNEQALTARNYLERNREVPTGDFCYSINTGRKHFEYRLAVASQNRDELRDALSAIAGGGSPRGAIRGASGKPPKVAFLFTGQGSQYAGMGRQLYESQPVFRAALDRCAALFDTLLNRSLLDLLFAAEGTAAADLLNQTGYTQPALFAIEYAVSEMWHAWGIRPDVVLGHSVGEIAAMCVAGGVSLDDGLKLIAARGRLMQALPAGGVMTSVMADERRVLEAIAGAEDLVAIAAINTPGQVVISGAGTAVAEIAARLTADGIKTKPLVVSHAFHSPLMKPMLAEYERVVRSIRFSPPCVPFVSGVDGVLAGSEITRTEYWLRNVIEPVRFAAGAKTLESQQVNAYVEVGPHPVLLGMTRQCVSDEGVAWLPSLRKEADGWQTVAGAVAELYARGADIDWKGFDQPYHPMRVSVPTYRFTRKEYWIRNVPAVTTAAADASSDDRHQHGGAALYELAWRKSPSGTVGSNKHQDSAHWIVIADRGGIGNELARRLSERSVAVTVVAAADASGALRWKRDASASSSTCIVDLRGLDLASDGDDVQRGVSDAVDLTQAIVRAAEHGAKLWLVTRDAMPASPGAGVALAAAPLWGLGRTIALEHPEHWGGLIDVSFDTPASAAQALAEELLSCDNEDQISLSSAGRYVARLVRSSVRTGEESLPPPPLSGDGAYLVTGGTGALGLHVARWLVASGARRLVLASRSAAINDRASATIVELEKLGASVTVVCADVSRRGDVDRLIGDITAVSALKGIVHAAGVDSVVPLSAMTASDVSAALGGKAIGAWLLHERTRSLNLDLFVCFSSMSSVLGAQGRAHYSAANAFLDALVAERRRRGLAGSSINWGPWSGGGMASAEDLRQFSEIGNRALIPDAAVRALGTIVARGTPQTMVADIDWETFRPVYEARRPRPVLAELVDDEADVPEAAAASAAAPWLVSLQSVTPAERVSQLAVLLRREVAETLGFDGPESVPLEKSFYDLGMDSLMMADLVGRLKNRVGVSCTGLVFDHPNVRALAGRMLERLPLDDRAASPAAASAPAPAVREEHATGFDAATQAEILAFQPRMFPDRRADWIEPRWRWMFVDSAARLGVMPRVWLHRDEGAIVGQMGSIPVRVKIGDDHVNTGWLVDTMVMEDYRHQAVGSRLMVESQDDQPFSLSLGQSAEMREIQFRLGWKQVAPLQIAQLLVRPGNVLKGKMPAPAAWAADLGLRASSALRMRSAAGPTLVPAVVERFDQRHDALWEMAAGHLTCAVIRDASYLNWKYVAQPGQDFLRLQLCDGTGLKGVVVWMMREPDANYRYRRAFLVDVIAPFADPVALQQIITSACAAAADRGADALLCHHLNGRLTQALRACGFHLRKPERFFLVSPGELPAASLDRVLAADNWLITHGDSDIDRPW